VKVATLNQSQIAARGSAVTLVGQGLRFAIQTASLVVLARILLPADYGYVAMVMAIVGIATLISDFGLTMAAIQAKELSFHQKSNLFWTNLVIGSVAASAVYGLSWGVASFYDAPLLVDLTQSLSVVFVINALAAQFRAELTRSMKFVRLAVVDVSAQLIALTVAIWVALSGGGYWALVAQQLAVAGGSLGVAVVLSGWLPGMPRRHQDMRRLLRFGSAAMGTQLVGYISSNADSVILGRVWGANVLGIYTRAYQLFTMPMMQLAAPMTNVALPVLSRIDDEELYLRYAVRAQVVLSYLVGGSFAVLAALAEPIVVLLFGDRWSAAAPILAILAAGGVFQAFSYLYYWVFLSKAKVGVHFACSTVGRGVMVGLILVFAQWGAPAVALASSLGLAIIWLILSFIGIPRTGIPSSALVRPTLRPLLAFLGLIVSVRSCLYLVASKSELVQLFTGAASVGIYMVVCTVVSRGVRRDLRMVWNTAKLAVR
jgi:O-antigen/teichoic acid export membrane protein